VISVVKSGQVVEEGHHDELIRKMGFYYRLQTQNSGAKKIEGIIEEEDEEEEEEE
jgi:ABC-type transport system involved in cytochrome bd biosynthesis fused ATPase/permease subunit